MSEGTCRELADIIFEHLGEASPDFQASLFKWKGEFQQREAEDKAPARAESSTSRKKSKASLKVGSTAKRLKASAGSPKSAPRSEKPESRAKTLTPSVIDVASGNVNYAAALAGASHGKLQLQNEMQSALIHGPAQVCPRRLMLPGT